MKLPPFASGHRLFRGNLHGHSTHSDGLLDAEAVVNAYVRLGYDFTCLSDHLWIDKSFAALNVLDSAYLDCDAFITLRSAELHCYGKRFDQDGLWHILANGLPLDFSCSDANETAPELVDRALAAGAYVSLAHPEWYSMTGDEALSLAMAHAVEIYNYSATISSARGSGIAIADRLLNEGKNIGFIATDDSHFNMADFGGGWVMVAAPELSQAAIIKALKAGQHYASSGADFINMSLQKSILTVETSEVDSVILSGTGHKAMAREGKNLTHVEFDLSKFASDWFRVTIRDKVGKMAWSNPYFKTKLGYGE